LLLTIDITGCSTGLTHACIAQVFFKGRAKRHPDAVDGRNKKATPVADFLMEGNQNVTYGKIIHQVSSPGLRHLLLLTFLCKSGSLH